MDVGGAEIADCNPDRTHGYYKQHVNGRCWYPYASIMCCKLFHDLVPRLEDPTVPRATVHPRSSLSYEVHSIDAESTL